MQRIQPYLGDRPFYKHILAVMLPIIIQQMINALFNMVDNVMVGSLGALAMSAVTTANKPYLIFYGVFFGMTGAAGLMISQFWGADDKEKCQGLFVLQQLIGICVGTLFTSLLLFFPRDILQIFVHDPQTVSLGMDYLTIVCFSYLPAAVSNVCMFSLRFVGQNRSPMLISILTMAINAFFNYILIYGAFGIAPMGVQGAAWGTVISRTVEMLLYVAILISRRTGFSLDFRAIRSLNRPMLRMFLQRAIPLTLNEIFYNLAFTIYYWSFARLNEAVLPAVTIAEQIQQINSVMSIGMGSTVSYLIGTDLGAGLLDKARADCKRFIGTGLIFSVCAVSLGVLCAFVVPGFFRIDAQLQASARIQAFIYILFYPFSSVYIVCFFTLRAGGCAREATLLDSVYLYLAPVPAALLLGFFGAGTVSIEAAILTIQVLNACRIFPAVHVLRKEKWVRNLTLTDTQESPS